MPENLANQNVHQADIPDPPEDGGSRTLRRGLAVLDAILTGPVTGLRVAELCEACELERATIYRLLATLIESGYVAKSGRFRYVPSRRSSALQPASGTPPVQADIASRLLPVLARVTEVSGDASFAIMREGLTTSSCVARQIGTHPVQILSVQVGTRQPLGVGAAGLAYLAALPVAETDRIVQAQAQGGELERYGGMTADRLKLLARATRERGYAVVGNHAAKGALGVGIAVLDKQAAPVAAISVAAEIARMTKSHQRLIIASMREALGAAFPSGI